MSLYNMINGVKPAAFFIWPFIGDGLHPETLPRFRDVFLADNDMPEYNEGHIMLYTRTGGGNRDDYEDENNDLRCLPGFVTDYDDPNDCTYAVWVYTVPSDFREDYDRFIAGDIPEFSEAAQLRCRHVYPKLAATFDKLWPATAFSTEERARTSSESGLDRVDQEPTP